MPKSLQGGKPLDVQDENKFTANRQKRQYFAALPTLKLAGKHVGYLPQLWLSQDQCLGHTRNYKNPLER